MLLSQPPTRDLAAVPVLWIRIRSDRRFLVGSVSRSRILGFKILHRSNLFGAEKYWEYIAIHLSELFVLCISLMGHFLAILLV
jgi:hypothetical protein